MDDEELETLKKRAEFYGLDKTKDFADYKKKYLTASTKMVFTEKESRLLGIKKTVDNKSFLSYNSSPEKEAYDRAIKTGELTPLASFELYQAISQEIDNIIVGVTAANGIVVKSKSYHFIARVIGSVEQNRNGVSIKSILAALNEPDRIDPVKERKNGKTQRFILKGVCAVTINPDTGNLIQVNPLR